MNNPAGNRVTTLIVLNQQILSPTVQVANILQFLHGKFSEGCQVGLRDADISGVGFLGTRLAARPPLSEAVREPRSAIFVSW